MIKTYEMKPLLICFLLAIFGSVSSFSQNYTWSLLSNFPGLERDDAIAFAIDNSVYIGSGNHGGLGESNRFYKLNIESGSWQSITSFPGVPRQYAQAAVIDDKAYLIGGIDWNYIPLNDCWMYDPLTDSWTELSAHPGAPRWQGACFVIKDQLYYGTGRDWDESYHDFYRYSPIENQWERIADLPTLPRYEAVSFAFDNEGFVGLGRDCTGVYLSSFFSYNATNKEWQIESDFPGEKRYYAKAQALGGRAAICGGQNEVGNMLEDVWIYSIIDRSWNRIDDLPNGAARGMSSCAIPFFGIIFCTGLNADFSRSNRLDLLTFNEEEDELSELFYNQVNGFISIDGLRFLWRISVYDISGKLIFDTRAEDRYLRIETSGWSIGTYLVTVNGVGRKIVIY